MCIRDRHAEGQPTDLSCGGSGHRRSNVIEPGMGFTVTGPTRSTHSEVEPKSGGHSTSTRSGAEAEEVDVILLVISVETEPTQEQ